MAETADPAGVLVGTSWRLVEFQSMDDAADAIRPDVPSRYTMQLLADGTVIFTLNCNHATGSWTARPGDDGSNGFLEFGPLAATNALCPPPSMDEQIAGQASFVRSYAIHDGRLHLSLMADGGTYVWEPDGPLPSAQTD